MGAFEAHCLWSICGTPDKIMKLSGIKFFNVCAHIMRYYALLNYYIIMHYYTLLYVLNFHHYTSVCSIWGYKRQSGCAEKLSLRRHT